MPITTGRSITCPPKLVLFVPLPDRHKALCKSDLGAYQALTQVFAKNSLDPYCTWSEIIRYLGFNEFVGFLVVGLGGGG